MFNIEYSIFYIWIAHFLTVVLLPFEVGAHFLTVVFLPFEW